ERSIGFSRGIQVGKHIFISGTTAFSDKSKVRSKMDSYEQTKLTIENISEVLTRLSSSLKDVIRTNVFVCPATDWRAVGKAHGEFFGDTRPISTFLWTNFFSNPETLVEIEADAKLG
ncbi:MAG TPA: Rid family hydrolase, partial [Nitrososphaerales archaeon]|nr:Rid family hydrolase [Nitrososphaerales archaeon]